MNSKKDTPRGKRSNPLAGSSGKILSPRSSVWQFFDLNRETRRARCRFCEKVLAYTGGTTNLRYHLTAAHAMEEFEVIGPSAKVFKAGKSSPVRAKKLPKKRPKVRVDSGDFASSIMSAPPQAVTTFTATKGPAVPTETPQIPASAPQILPSPPHQQQSSSTFFKKRFKNKERDEGREGTITERLVYMIIKSLQPLEFVTSEGFRGYMKFLEPSYLQPDVQYIKSKILTMFEECKDKVKETLARDAAHYSIVYDVWKGSDQAAYSTINVHYLTSNWERRSHALGTESVAQVRASGNEISNCIRTLLYHYDLPVESLVTTLNRQGMLKSQVERVGTVLGCESMSCAAEKLDLCVQAAFAIPEVSALIDQVRQLISYLVSDEEASRMMQDLKETDGFFPQAELVEERTGGWIGTADMLMKFVESRDTVDRISELDLTGTDLFLDLDSWELAEKMVNSLQILRAALTVMSKETTGSVSCLLPVVHSILQHCEDANHAQNSPMEKFLKTIGKETREKWDLTAILPSSVPMLAALLDPRFKKLKFIAEEDKVDVLEALKGVLASSPGIESASEGHLRTESQDVTPFLCLFGGGEEYTQDRQDVDTEISNYIEFPALRHDSCPLDWWRVNQGRFPQLAKLARQFLSVPAIAQPIGDIMAGSSRVDLKRGLLEMEVADPLIFLNHNFSLVQS